MMKVETQVISITFESQEELNRIKAALWCAAIIRAKNIPIAAFKLQKNTAAPELEGIVNSTARDVLRALGESV